MPWLEWHKRDDDLKATAKTPYRLLQPIQSLSHGDEDAPNMLIQDDNLEALRYKTESGSLPRSRSDDR